MPPPNPKVPPVAVGLIVSALMWLVKRVAPAFVVSIPGKWVIAAVIAGIAVVIAALAIGRFVRARTTVNPMEPAKATTLVTDGIFAVTRNPMYLGLLLLLIAWAVVLANGLTLAVIPLYVAYMNRFQIGPEETAMAERFGEAFTAYRARVRRWI